MALIPSPHDVHESIDLVCQGRQLFVGVLLAVGESLHRFGQLLDCRFRAIHRWRWLLAS